MVLSSTLCHILSNPGNRPNENSILSGQDNNRVIYMSLKKFLSCPTNFKIVNVTLHIYLNKMG